MVDRDVEARLRPYLRSGEHLVWVGAPMQGLMFTTADLLLIPFSLVWGGFAIFWEISVLRLTPRIVSAGEASANGVLPIALIMPLFGGVFVLVGLFMIVGRFFLDAWLRARMDYGLTETRALVLKRGFGQQLQSAPLEEDVKLLKRSDGRGTIQFGRPMGMFGVFGGQRGAAWVPSLGGQVQFLNIDKVMDVYRLAQAAAR